MLWSVETTQFVLSNGLEVVLINDPNTSVASVRTIVEIRFNS